MRSLIARILLFTLAFVVAAHAAEPVVFPTVSFYTLSKERVTLPADLHGDRNLLLLYFDLTQERDINDWNAVIDRWNASDPSLGSYTLLVSPPSIVCNYIVQYKFIQQYLAIKHIVFCYFNFKCSANQFIIR